MKGTGKSQWGAYRKLHDKKKMWVARLKGYLDGLPPKTRRRIVLVMFAIFATLALLIRLPSFLPMSWTALPKVWRASVAKMANMASTMRLRVFGGKPSR